MAFFITIFLCLTIFVAFIILPMTCEYLLAKKMLSFKEMFSEDGKTHITEKECSRVLFIAKMCRESSAYVFYEEGVKTLVVSSCSNGNVKVYNLVVV